MPLALVGLCALYLVFLTRMGMVGPDEPRYADIGRAMARTGDWITPRLWGEPWFEKPALLYWMTGAGFRLGLSDDLGPRLPVALLSIAFLVYFFLRVRKLWDEATAWTAAAILATSAGWLTYSHVAVTDLPLAVCFSVAVLLLCEPEDKPVRAVSAAIALALAVLAKGLVPLVLILPALAFSWPRRLEWLRPVPVVAFLAVATPWYLLCWQQNGFEFIRVFFLEHHFGRFATNALEHKQPFWYYLPILLALLFPWTFVLGLGIRETGDRRTRVLAGTAIFGFVFFSAAVNKLPGYLLPLVPSLAILMARSLVLTPKARWPLVTAIAGAGVIPFAGSVIPAALTSGLRHVQTASLQALVSVPLFLAVGQLCASRFPKLLFPLAVALAASVFCGLQYTAFPAIDEAASARTVWNRSRPVCAPNGPRALVYGLNYYAVKKLPDCPRD